MIILADEKNKLRHFKDAVYAEAEERADSIIKEAEQLTQQKKAEVENAVKQNEAAQFLKIDKNTQARIIKETSAEQLNSNRNILLHRKALAEKVFDNVQSKLEQFRNSEKYQQHLINLVKSAMNRNPDEKGTVFIGKADEKYKASLEKTSGLQVKIKPTILLGGLIVSFEDLNIMLDCTFDSAVAEEKENFCKNSELAL